MFNLSKIPPIHHNPKGTPVHMTWGQYKVSARFVTKYSFNRRLSGSIRVKPSLSPRDIVTLSEISGFSFNRFCSSEQLLTLFRLAGILKICVENTSALGMFPQLSSLASSEPLI